MADSADTKTLAELREARNAVIARINNTEAIAGAPLFDNLAALGEALAADHALIAEQQQRIEALEAGLEPFGKIWTAWREYAVEHMDYPSDFNRWLHGLLSSSREHDMYQRAHDLLHAVRR